MMFYTLIAFVLGALVVLGIQNIPNELKDIMEDQRYQNSH